MNKTVVETVSDEEVSRVRFTAWDLIDVCDFDKGVDKRTGVERLERLRAIPANPLFEVVQTFEIADLEAALIQAKRDSAGLEVKGRSRVLHLILDNIAERNLLTLKLRK